MKFIQGIGVAASLATVAGLTACGGGGDSATPPQFQFKVTKTEDMQGSFGAAGAYERITGKFTGEVDPKDSRNAIITDLQFAPTNANGKVVYTADVVLFKPKDMRKASGLLRYDTPNRGRVVEPDPYFAARGHVFVNVGWQGDLVANGTALTIDVPVARNPDGSSITGTYRAELFASTATASSLALPGGAFNTGAVAYAPASLDNAQPGYALTKRVNQADARQPIPASDWKFAKCDAATPFPGTPSPTDLCVKGGVDPSFIYELVYVAKDPKVMGLGFAAVRDAVSFFATATAAADGTPNPVAGAIRHTLGSGVSQSGNFMKTLVHLGFNQRLDGAKLFDGVFAQIAARQNNLNMRFAIPGGGGGVRADFDAFGQAGTRGLAADYVDDLRGTKAGILARCEASGTCPKLFVGYSSTEFWTLQGSPILTDALGTRDLVQPANARIYAYAGTQHVLGVPSLPPEQAAQLFGPAALGKYPTNGNLGVLPVIKALYRNLEDWVVAGTLPPDSVVPTLAGGTLVRPDQVAFPSIPGVVFTGLATPMRLWDWGPSYRPQDESGVPTIVPPRDLGRAYAILVPQVDVDGNEIAGIRSVDIAAPLATETGWNTSARAGLVDQAHLVGSHFPLTKTREERLAKGDPRLSLQERYGSQDGYVAAVRAAAADLVARRFMLPEDASAAIAAAQSRAVLP
ncbi:MAG TPA: alpha/beta hydrolase domain-containing protein [Pseudorhodoferax sp.]|nr:alpha/beta hydrolase domain-containing protein [Pseudorhodoferax sp.]